jgi:amidohydrolase
MRSATGDGNNTSPDPRFVALSDVARGLQPKTVALRRAVHRDPELGLSLPRTQAAIRHALRDLPLEIHTGTGCTSVVAVLRGKRPGPTVLLRGDMDALPLTEDTGLDYASANEGTMHACGHDTHVAMLASAARLLCARRDALAGQVVFMFQPGEEGCHGARVMLDEGLLDVAGSPVRQALALHITATMRSGVLSCRPGTIMAASDTFTIGVRGRGGHASAPHEALDPVPVAAEMVGALQTMMSRRVSTFNPAVLTVAKIAAGTTTNVIPETAELIGTIRTLAEGTRELVHTELRRVCEHVGAAHGCSVTVSIEPGYPPTVNDAALADGVISLADDLLGAGCGQEMAQPLMGAEDFSYVLREVPGALAFVGACPPGVEPADAAPNHSNRVLFDESALPVGVAMYTGFALDALR